MNTYHPGSRTARVVDQLLDLLLAGVLLGAPLIFYTKAYDVFEFNKITAVRVLCSLAAPLLMFKLLFVRPLKLTRSALDLPVLAWLAVVAACTYSTVNRRLSTHGVFEDFEGITTWCMYAFLFWWPLQHVRTERQIRLILGTIALAGTVAGFYGLLQNFGIDFVPWNPDTYNAARMFSTMGNPNFLAAYTVMSMPITFVLFLDLPDRIRTDKGFCAALIGLGLLASAGLCVLFKTNYFSLTPADFGATDVLHMLGSLKFWVTKVLLAFPLICAVLLYFGRLRWVLLLSLTGQLASTLFTKSRGGVFSIAAIVALFGLAFAYEVFGKKAFSLKGLLILAATLAAGALVFITGIWEPALRFAFEEQRVLGFLVFLGVLAGLHFVVKRQGGQGRVAQSLPYMLGLLVIVWGLLFIPAIRQTTYEMLERTGKLFHPSEVKYTPRLFIWKSALAMLRDNPWLGKGLDTFQISFPPYREAIYWLLEWNGTPEKAHNFVMQTAATMGVLGLLAFLWMHLAWVRSCVRDWLRQPDESRRLLIMACFGAWLGFFVQNLFSFTVVGYGSLWWVLWGFVPAMQRTWETEKKLADAPADAAGQVLEPIPAGGSAWSSPRIAWAVGLGMLSLILLGAALAGPNFFADKAPLGQPAIALLEGKDAVPSYWPLRILAVIGGLAALLGVLFLGRRDQEDGAGALGWALLAAASVGGFFFAWHSSKIWVADSFYKQGQVGMSVGQPGYAAAMYQKSAGQLANVNNEQLTSIHQPLLPPQVQPLQIKPSLNPDQELYWVKMGISFESAAAGSAKPEDKLLYYRTALAIHQYTLEMNPINGYNYNNKGRVLKAMGEAFQDRGYFEMALAHYDKAIALDKHNVYFNLDKANTLLSLGRPADSLAVCQHLNELFPGFAVPYSYAGFIKMQAGKKDEAIKYFSKAVEGEWYRDMGSKALAATNLGLLQRQANRLTEAEQAFRAAIAANPAQQEASLNLADILLRARRGPEGVAVLQALLKAVPGQPQALETLKRLGVQ